jgi:hypothetical protein
LWPWGNGRDHKESHPGNYRNYTEWLKCRFANDYYIDPKFLIDPDYVIFDNFDCVEDLERIEELKPYDECGSRYYRAGETSSYNPRLLMNDWLNAATRAGVLDLLSLPNPSSLIEDLDPCIEKLITKRGIYGC